MFILCILYNLLKTVHLMLCKFVLGYVRFLNDRREKVRSENPNLPFPEITKLLAVEWSQLPANQKQVTLSNMLIRNYFTIQNIVSIINIFNKYGN